MKFTLQHFIAFNDVVLTLNVLRRWTGTMTDPKYDEITKQAYNCMFAYFLALEIESTGERVDYLRLIKCAIYRAFQKAYLFCDTPEHIYREICICGGIDYETAMATATHNIISGEAGEEFAEWLEDCIGTFEQDIYCAATKLVTFFEVKENQLEMNGDYADILLYITKKVEQFDFIPAFKEMRCSPEYLNIFKEVTRLRNQNRWATLKYTIPSAVSGHLFDAAVFAFFNAYNKYGQEEAIRQFFIGIFHDVPERYTRDIPSPVKEMIPNFRKATEMYECEMMEKNFYPKLPKHIAASIRKIALEEVPEELKGIGKIGDYLSAGSEIYRQTPDIRFVEAMSKNKAYLTGKYCDHLSPEALEFFEILEKRVHDKF